MVYIPQLYVFRTYFARIWYVFGTYFVRIGLIGHVGDGHLRAGLVAGYLTIPNNPELSLTIPNYPKLSQTIPNYPKLSQTIPNYPSIYEFQGKPSKEDIKGGRYQRKTSKEDIKGGYRTRMHAH